MAVEFEGFFFLFALPVGLCAVQDGADDAAVVDVVPA